jgi:hypothetical protein
MQELDIDIHKVNPGYIVVNFECDSSKESKLMEADWKLQHTQVVKRVKKGIY